MASRRAAPVSVCGSGVWREGRTEPGILKQAGGAEGHVTWAGGGYDINRDGQGAAILAARRLFVAALGALGAGRAEVTEGAVAVAAVVACTVFDVWTPRHSAQSHRANKSSLYSAAGVPATAVAVTPPVTRMPLA